MYMYTEADAKKGANEMVSFLNHFLQNFVGEGKTQLKIFSDGCVGQHKNLTILRNYHVHIQSGRFNKIVHRYPVTGHSYLPCDQKFTVIEKIKRTQQTVETPQQWLSLVKNHTKFHVIHVTCNVSADSLHDTHLKSGSWVDESLKPLGNRDSGNRYCNGSVNTLSIFSPPHNRG